MPGSVLPRSGAAGAPWRPVRPVVGREEVFRELDRRLPDGPDDLAPRRVVLVGPPGIGKATAVASWLLTRRGEAPVWVDARGLRCSLSLSALAGELGLKLADLPPGELLEAIGRALSSRPRRPLVVLDAAPEPTLGLPAEIDGRCDVIATTSWSDYPFSDGLRVGPLSHAEGVSLLASLAPRSARRHLATLVERVQGEPATLVLLGRALHYTAAGSLLDELEAAPALRGASLQDWLFLRGPSALPPRLVVAAALPSPVSPAALALWGEEPPPTPGSRLGGWEKVVAPLRRLAERLRGPVVHPEGGFEVAQRLSRAGGEVILTDVGRRLGLGEGEAGLARRLARGLLARSTEEEALPLELIPSAVAALQLPPSARAPGEVAELASRLSLALLDAGLVAEARGVVEAELEISPPSLGRAHLLARAAQIHGALGEVGEALSLEQRRLQSLLPLVGEDHIDVWRARWALGRSLSAVGRKSEGAPLMVEARRHLAQRGEWDTRSAQGAALEVAALLMDLGHLDEVRPEAPTLITLAQSDEAAPAARLGAMLLLARLHEGSDREEALRWCREAGGLLEEMERSGGELRPMLGPAWHTVGRSHLQLGEAPEAVAALKRAQAARVGHKPVDRRALAAVLHDLGLALLAAERPTEAVGPLRAAVSLRERLRPPEPGPLSESLAMSGQALMRLRREDDALAAMSRALEVVQGLEGPFAGVSFGCVELGRLLMEQGKLPEAEEAHRRLLKVQEATVGAEHPIRAATLTGLAQVHLARGEHQEVVTLLSQAYELRLRALGPDAPEVLHAQHRLGRALTAAGRPQEAEGLLTAALEAHRRVLGPLTTPTAGVLFSLGQAQLSRGGAHAALETLQQALWQEWQLHGEGHPSTAGTLFGLGQAYAALARFWQAVELYQKTLAIEEKVHGRSHPTVAATLHEMGSCLVAAGRGEDAVRALQRAVKIRARMLGEAHAATVASTFELGTALLSLARVEAAVKSWERALTAQERLTGEASPRVIGLLTAAGQNLARRGQLGRARLWLARALDRATQAEGPQGRSVLGLLHQVALLDLEEGDHAGAGPVVADVLARRRAHLGEEHPDVALSLVALAHVHTASGEYLRAAELLEQARAIATGALGEDHVASLSVLGEQARLAQLRGQVEEAAALLERKKAAEVRVLGESHAAVAATLHDLGLVMLAAGRLPRAHALLQEAADARQRYLGADHPATWMSRAELARAQEEDGDLQAAARRAEAIERLTTLLGQEHPQVRQLTGASRNLLN